LHRLVDKVMSGSYYNYQQARGINQRDEPSKTIDPSGLEDFAGVKAIHPYV
jgi:hypothetical protein